MSICSTCGTEFGPQVRICPLDGTALSGSEGELTLGRVLDSKYRLDARLGQGGMGTIYKATHLRLDKSVAVKLINPNLSTDAEFVRRFQREAKAASRLEHPNIAVAHDFGATTDGTLYMVMEFVDGQTLRDVLRADGPLDPPRIVRILRQVADALERAHEQSVVHRDLKPQNIMLAKGRKGQEVVKLLDFGIAKSLSDGPTQLTATGLVLGTPQYMSPEQVQATTIDGRSDLYALGVILYEMLIGEVPFNKGSALATSICHLHEHPVPPSVRRPDLVISPTLEAIAMRCLEKKPDDRFASAGEFAEALEGVATEPAPPLPSDVADVPVAAPAAPTIPTPIPTLDFSPVPVHARVPPDVTPPPGNADTVIEGGEPLQVRPPSAVPPDPPLAADVPMVKADREAPPSTPANDYERRLGHGLSKDLGASPFFLMLVLLAAVVAFLLYATSGT
jgi:eukaryotic-like serine/threonine-protein kinase